MSLVLKISDTVFTDPTLPMLQRDSVVDAGTKFLFDFADPYGWPKQAAPVNNDQFVNFVDGGDPAVTLLAGGSTMTFSGGGIGFDADMNEGIVLPVSGNLPVNNQGFLFCLWVKHGQQLDQTSTGAVGGFAYQSGQWCQYAIEGNNANDEYRFVCGGLNIHYPFPAVDSIHQMAMAVVKSGANMVLRGFVDGAQTGIDVVLGAAATWLLPQPSNAGAGAMNSPELGFLSGFTQNWVGSVYRTYLTDIGATGTDPLAIVQADYAANNGRFT